MARQRRTLDEQIAELTLRGRSERAQIMSTPEMAPVGPDMIEENAIHGEHIAMDAVRLENLDDSLKETIASLSENGEALAGATERLDEADKRLDDLFDEVTILPGAITSAASNALNTALAAAARGANVVANGSFEQDFAGWDKEVTQSGGNYGIDTAVFRTGTRSFYSTKNGGFRQGPIPVTTGETWEFSLWFKTDDAYTSSNAGGLRLQSKGADGDTWKDVASTTLKASPTDWSQSTLRYVIPAGISQIRARFAFNYTGGAKVWVDDISLVNITAELAAAADVASKTKALQEALTASEAATITKMNNVANSKNATLYGTVDPIVAGVKGSLAGDTYRRRDAKGNIIGEYEWDGAKWTQRKMTSESMTAVDIGVLTAGSAVIDDAVAKTIAAGTASIQEADIKNLKVTDTSNLSTVVAERIAANTGSFMDLYAENVTIGSASNYIPDPAYQNAEMQARRNATSTCTVTATTDQFLRIKPSTAVTYFRPLGVPQTPAAFASWIPTKPGDVWRFQMGVKGWQGDGTWSMQFVGRTKDGKAYANPAEKTTIPANATDTFEVIATVPANCFWIMPEIRVPIGTVDSFVTPNSMVMERMVDANLIVDGTIQARSLQLVAGNLFPDPNLEDVNGWGTYKPAAGIGRHGANGINIPATTTQAGGYYGISDRARQFAVTGGDSYRVSAWVKPAADVPAKSMAVYMKWSNPTTAVGGSFPTISNVTNPEPIKAGVWTELSGLISLPKEATKAYIGFYTQSTANVAAVFSNPAVRAATDASVMADIVLSSKIVAGDPEGTRAEMSPQGFKVFGKASGDTTSDSTYEIVRLGVADTNDMFAIADKDGITQASISETGTMSGKELYISDEINFKGDQLSELLWSLPKGHVASAFRYNNSAYNAKAGGEWAPYLRIDVEVERNRLYRISTSPVRYGQDAGGVASMAITQSTGSIAQTTSVMIDKVDIYDGHDGNSAILSELAQLGGAVKDGPENDKVLASWLLMFRSDKGQFGIRASAVSPVRLLIEDVGPLRNTSPGVHLDTTSTNGVAPTPPPSKVTYTKDWGCNWIKSFDGAGNWYNYNASKGYQGLSPAGYGNMKTVMRFPDITGTVSGSVIHKVEVYLYFEHWYYNAGGTARIALAGSGVPTTYTGQNPVVTSGGWPKPGGRWVTIPAAHYGGFQNGTYRGITLEGDGSYGTYGIAHPGTLRVTYTK